VKLLDDRVSTARRTRADSPLQTFSIRKTTT